MASAVPNGSTNRFRTASPSAQVPARRPVPAERAADPDVDPARQRQGDGEDDEQQRREPCRQRIEAGPRDRGRSAGQQQQRGRQEQPHPTPGELENAEQVNVRAHGTVADDSISLRTDAAARLSADTWTRTIQRTSDCAARNRRSAARSGPLMRMRTRAPSLHAAAECAAARRGERPGGPAPPQAAHQSLQISPRPPHSRHRPRAGRSTRPSRPQNASCGVTTMSGTPAGGRRSPKNAWRIRSRTVRDRRKIDRDFVGQAVDDRHTPSHPHPKCPDDSGASAADGRA